MDHGHAAENLELALQAIQRLQELLENIEPAESSNRVFAALLGSTLLQIELWLQDDASAIRDGQLLKILTLLQCLCEVSIQFPLTHLQRTPLIQCREAQRKHGGCWSPAPSSRTDFQALSNYTGIRFTSNRSLEIFKHYCQARTETGRVRREYGKNSPECFKM